MNVVITGGAGYLGSVLAQQLLADGHRVRVVDSLAYGGESLLGLYPHDDFEFVRADIRDGVPLDGADAVVHLAAIVGDPACRRDPELASAVNLDASRALFAQATDVERFVFASTCSNYGRMGDPTQYVTEESELAPLSLYAESKVAVELELLAASDGPAVTIMRFATLYGLSPRMRFDLTVNEFAAELYVRRELEVYGDQFWRPYVHVADAARAVRLALGAPVDQVTSQVFNVGDTRENYTKADIVGLLRERIGDVDVRRVEIAEDPRDYRVSFEKIDRALGFTASRTVPDGLDEVIAAIASGVIPDFTEARYRN